MHTHLPRRSALLGLTSMMSMGGASLALAAAPTDQRFVVILLRGAMDGLTVVAPYGDPGLAALRAPLIPPQPGQERGMFDLGGTFGLHPAMSGAHDLYKANELLLVHAAAGPYRVRSHFEAQDLLEYGADHSMSSGWLNRVAGAIPSQASAGRLTQVDGAAVTGASMAAALAIGQTIPLSLRGPAPVSNWAPHTFGEPQPALYQQILALHRHDPISGPAIANGLRARGFTEDAVRDMSKEGGRFAFPKLAQAAGRLLGAAGGPRLAAMELGGWDTHTGQMGRLNGPLTELDNGLTALKTEMGDAWRKTVVLVMTEFGRTARINGTNGTDHGTASVAFVAGGAVAGGRVVANWPGLGRGQLYEDRDLAPTTDLRSIAKGILAAHLGLNGAALASVFPGGEAAQPMNGLVRTG
jgi:uncharacterized protein (DUF1501 family)